MTYRAILTKIDELRERGFKIKVSHLRQPPPVNVPPAMHDALVQAGFESIIDGELKSTLALRAYGISPNHKGGVTRVTIVDPDGGEYHGEAVVSKQDHFNKKIGLSAAFGRAFNAFIEGQVAQYETEIVRRRLIH